MSGNGETDGLAVYVRVSSESQDKAGSLTRQLDRDYGSEQERGHQAGQDDRLQGCSIVFRQQGRLSSLVDAIIDGRVQSCTANTLIG